MVIEKNYIDGKLERREKYDKKQHKKKKRKHKHTHKPEDRENTK
jgi:hypothetical protein